MCDYTWILWPLGAAAVLAEGWYWFVYFPRAWRDGSNSDIRSIRAYVEYLRRKRNVRS